MDYVKICSLTPTSSSNLTKYTVLSIPPSSIVCVVTVDLKKLSLRAPKIIPPLKLAQLISPYSCSKYIYYFGN